MRIDVDVGGDDDADQLRGSAARFQAGYHCDRSKDFDLALMTRRSSMRSEGRGGTDAAGTRSPNPVILCSISTARVGGWRYHPSLHGSRVEAY